MKKMSKTNHFTSATRKAVREASVQALREGRFNRAVTFTDRKKAASRNACRKGSWA